jgi:hypothetical protein
MMNVKCLESMVCNQQRLVENVIEDDGPATTTIELSTTSMIHSILARKVEW